MHTCFAYIRVSTAKQGTQGVSLQEQRSAIEAYADRNSIGISEWFEERETAAKRGRPVFNRMLKRLEDGEVLGVIIHKIDRGARNLRDWADLGELIDKGLKVHFATESLDLASRGGRLSADIQAVVAADYIRNLREETKKGFYGRLKQGLYPLAAPIGYLDTGSGKPKSIDPAKAPLVKHAFEAYASNTHTLKSLKKELRTLGLTNKVGKSLALSSVTDMLHNPFYAGVIRLRNKGDSFLGIHEPLISMQLFNEVQEILSGRAPKLKFKHDLTFRRMIKCAKCGHHLSGEVQKGHTYYRCHGDDCKGVSVREEVAESAVKRALEAIEISDEHKDLLLDECTELHSESLRKHEDFLRTYDARIEATKQRLDRLVDALVDGMIDRDSAQTRRTSLLIELADIEQQRTHHASNPAHGLVDLALYLEQAKTAHYQYKNGNTREKRETVRLIASNLHLLGKNVVVELQKPFQEIAEYQNDNESGPECRTGRTSLVHKLLKCIEAERLNTTKQNDTRLAA